MEDRKLKLVVDNGPIGKKRTVVNQPTGERMDTQRNLILARIIQVLRDVTSIEDEEEIVTAAWGIFRIFEEMIPKQRPDDPPTMWGTVNRAAHDRWIERGEV